MKPNLDVMNSDQKTTKTTIIPRPPPPHSIATNSVFTASTIEHNNRSRILKRREACWNSQQPQQFALPTFKLLSVAESCTSSSGANAFFQFPCTSSSSSARPDVTSNTKNNNGHGNFNFARGFPTGASQQQQMSFIEKLILLQQEQNEQEQRMMIFGKGSNGLSQQNKNRSAEKSAPSTFDKDENNNLLLPTSSPHHKNELNNNSNNNSNTNAPDGENLFAQQLKFMKEKDNLFQLLQRRQSSVSAAIDMMNDQPSFSFSLVSAHFASPVGLSKTDQTMMTASDMSTTTTKKQHCSPTDLMSSSNFALRIDMDPFKSLYSTSANGEIFNIMTAMSPSVVFSIEPVESLRAFRIKWKRKFAVSASTDGICWIPSSNNSKNNKNNDVAETDDDDDDSNSVSSLPSLILGIRPNIEGAEKRSAELTLDQIDDEGIRESNSSLRKQKERLWYFSNPPRNDIPSTSSASSSSDKNKNKNNNHGFATIQNLFLNGDDSQNNNNIELQKKLSTTSVVLDVPISTLVRTSCVCIRPLLYPHLSLFCHPETGMLFLDETSNNTDNQDKKTYEESSSTFSSPQEKLKCCTFALVRDSRTNGDKNNNNHNKQQPRNTSNNNHNLTLLPPSTSLSHHPKIFNKKNHSNNDNNNDNIASSPSSSIKLLQIRKTSQLLAGLVSRFPKINFFGLPSHHNRHQQQQQPANQLPTFNESESTLSSSIVFDAISRIELPSFSEASPQSTSISPSSSPPESDFSKQQQQMKNFLYVFRETLVSTSTSLDRNRFFFLFDDSQIQQTMAKKRKKNKKKQEATISSATTTLLKVTCAFGSKSDIVLLRGNETKVLSSSSSSSFSPVCLIQFQLHPQDFVDVLLCTKDTAFLGVVNVETVRAGSCKTSNNEKTNTFEQSSSPPSSITRKMKLSFDERKEKKVELDTIAQQATSRTQQEFEKYKAEQKQRGDSSTKSFHSFVERQQQLKNGKNSVDNDEKGQQQGTLNQTLVDIRFPPIDSNNYLDHHPSENPGYSVVSWMPFREYQRKMMATKNPNAYHSDKISLPRRRHIVTGRCSVDDDDESTNNIITSVLSWLVGSKNEEFLFKTILRDFSWSSSSFCSVWLCLNSWWQNVSVDEFLPVEIIPNDSQDNEEETKIVPRFIHDESSHATKSLSKSSLAIPFIHKALAKVTGGYSNLSSCPLRQILSLLLGCPTNEALQRNFYEAKYFQSSPSAKETFKRELLCQFGKSSSNNNMPIFFTKSASTTQSFDLEANVGYFISKIVVDDAIDHHDDDEDDKKSSSSPLLDDDCHITDQNDSKNRNKLILIQLVHPLRPSKSKFARKTNCDTSQLLWSGPWSLKSQLWKQHPHVAEKCGFSIIKNQNKNNYDNNNNIMTTNRFWMSLDDVIEHFDSVHSIKSSINFNSTTIPRGLSLNNNNIESNNTPRWMFEDLRFKNSFNQAKDYFPEIVLEVTIRRRNINNDKGENNDSPCCYFWMSKSTKSNQQLEENGGNNNNSRQVFTTLCIAEMQKKKTKKSSHTLTESNGQPDCHDDRLTPFIIRQYSNNNSCIPIYSNSQEEIGFEFPIFTNGDNDEDDEINDDDKKNSKSSSSSSSRKFLVIPKFCSLLASENYDFAQQQQQIQDQGSPKAKSNRNIQQQQERFDFVVGAKIPVISSNKDFGSYQIEVKPVRFVTHKNNNNNNVAAAAMTRSKLGSDDPSIASEPAKILLAPSEPPHNHQFNLLPDVFPTIYSGTNTQIFDLRPNVDYFSSFSPISNAQHQKMEMFCGNNSDNQRKKTSTMIQRRKPQRLNNLSNDGETDESTILVEEENFSDDSELSMIDQDEEDTRRLARNETRKKRRQRRKMKLLEARNKKFKGNSSRASPPTEDEDDVLSSDDEDNEDDEENHEDEEEDEYEQEEAEEENLDNDKSDDDSNKEADVASPDREYAKDAWLKKRKSLIANNNDEDDETESDRQEQQGHKRGKSIDDLPIIVAAANELRLLHEYYLNQDSLINLITEGCLALALRFDILPMVDMAFVPRPLRLRGGSNVDEINDTQEAEQQYKDNAIMRMILHTEESVSQMHLDKLPRSNSMLGNNNQIIIDSTPKAINNNNNSNQPNLRQNRHASASSVTFENNTKDSNSSTLVSDEATSPLLVDAILNCESTSRKVQIGWIHCSKVGCDAFSTASSTTSQLYHLIQEKLFPENASSLSRNREKMIQNHNGAVELTISFLILHALDLISTFTISPRSSCSDAELEERDRAGIFRLKLCNQDISSSNSNLDTSKNSNKNKIGRSRDNNKNNEKQSLIASPSSEGGEGRWWNEILVDDWVEGIIDQNNKQDENFGIHLIRKVMSKSMGGYDVASRADCLDLLEMITGSVAVRLDKQLREAQQNQNDDKKPTTMIDASSFFFDLLERILKSCDSGTNISNALVLVTTKTKNDQEIEDDHHFEFAEDFWLSVTRVVKKTDSSSSFLIQLQHPFDEKFERKVPLDNNFVVADDDDDGEATGKFWMTSSEFLQNFNSCGFINIREKIKYPREMRTRGRFVSGFPSVAFEICFDDEGLQQVVENENTAQSKPFSQLEEKTIEVVFGVTRTSYQDDAKNKYPIALRVFSLTDKMNTPPIFGYRPQNHKNKDIIHSINHLKSKSIRDNQGGKEDDDDEESSFVFSLNRSVTTSCTLSNKYGPHLIVPLTSHYLEQQQHQQRLQRNSNNENGNQEQKNNDINKDDFDYVLWCSVNGNDDSNNKNNFKIKLVELDPDLDVFDLYDEFEVYPEQLIPTQTIIQTTTTTTTTNRTISTDDSGNKRCNLCTSLASEWSPTEERITNTENKSFQSGDSKKSSFIKLNHDFFTSSSFKLINQRNNNNNNNNSLTDIVRKARKSIAAIGNHLLVEGISYGVQASLQNNNNNRHHRSQLGMFDITFPVLKRDMLPRTGKGSSPKIHWMKPKPVQEHNGGIISSSYCSASTELSFGLHYDPCTDLVAALMKLNHKNIQKSSFFLGDSENEEFTRVRLLQYGWWHEMLLDNWLPYHVSTVNSTKKQAITEHQDDDDEQESPFGVEKTVDAVIVPAFAHSSFSSQSIQFLQKALAKHCGSYRELLNGNKLTPIQAASLVFGNEFDVDDFDDVFRKNNCEGFSDTMKMKIISLMKSGEEQLDQMKFDRLIDILIQKNKDCPKNCHLFEILLVLKQEVSSTSDNSRIFILDQSKLSNSNETVNFSKLFLKGDGDGDLCDAEKSFETTSELAAACDYCIAVILPDDNDENNQRHLLSLFTTRILNSPGSHQMILTNDRNATNQLDGKEKEKIQTQLGSEQHEHHHNNMLLTDQNVTCLMFSTEDAENQSEQSLEEFIISVSTVNEANLCCSRRPAAVFQIVEEEQDSSEPNKTTYNNNNTSPSQKTRLVNCENVIRPEQQQSTNKTKQNQVDFRILTKNGRSNEKYLVVIPHHPEACKIDGCVIKVDVVGIFSKINNSTTATRNTNEIVESICDRIKSGESKCINFKYFEISTLPRQYPNMETMKQNNADGDDKKRKKQENRANEKSDDEVVLMSPSQMILDQIAHNCVVAVKPTQTTFAFKKEVELYVESWPSWM